jgi:uncharacterized protein YodC (DUF2158 family)
MQKGDIVYLKSGSPKLMVEFVIGEDSDSPIDPSEFYKKKHSIVKDGDVVVKWISNKKPIHNVFPKNALIEALDKEDLILKDKNIKKGSIVKNKLTDQKMVVVWILGKEKGEGLLDIDSLYLKQGSKPGDLLCKWFDNTKLEYNYIPIHQIE